MGIPVNLFGLHEQCFSAKTYDSDSVAGFEPFTVKAFELLFLRQLHLLDVIDFFVCAEIVQFSQS